jgi:hypothetical protein
MVRKMSPAAGVGLTEPDCHRGSKASRSVPGHRKELTERHAPTGRCSVAPQIASFVITKEVSQGTVGEG